MELSLDHDWLRYRTSFFYSSGDRNPKGNTATGFDSIADNPNFAGGTFSYWDRVSLVGSGAGINITDGNSLIPDLRTSKADGQANFVNPGLFLYNSPVAPVQQSESDSLCRHRPVGTASRDQPHPRRSGSRFRHRGVVSSQGIG
jgi:hypothetical protein